MPVKKTLPIVPGSKYEWAYTCIERGKETWQGSFGGSPTMNATATGRASGDGGMVKAGKARPGRITGGLVVAETEQEAKRLIIKDHGAKTEITYLSQRGQVL